MKTVPCLSCSNEAQEKSVKELTVSFECKGCGSLYKKTLFDGEIVSYLVMIERKDGCYFGYMNPRYAERRGPMDLEGMEFLGIEEGNVSVDLQAGTG